MISDDSLMPSIDVMSRYTILIIKDRDDIQVTVSISKKNPPVSYMTIHYYM